jgi:hypothetical protein
MANTADLIALQAEYPTAFADPEATPEDPTLPEPDEEGRTGETPQDGSLLGEAIASNLETMHPDQVRDFAEGHPQEQTGDDSGVIEFEQKERWFDSDKLTAPEWCQYYLGQLKNDPRSLSIAADYLEKLADIAEMNRAVSSKKYHSKGSGTLRPLDEVVDEVSAPIVINLPETHARQGTAECPGGLCSMDH